ncbi:MAG: nucleoside hydrolase [Opitutales bacterium]|nr:nucleoside hydrolase [Opitutales bacterium]
MKFPKVSPQYLPRLLSGRKGRVAAVLDTDTYNEVDDQFALAHAVLSPDKIDLQAVYAAPFFNFRSTDPGEGMEKSFCEIHRILKLMGRDGSCPVFRGSRSYLPAPDSPVKSAAAQDLVARAQNCRPSKPLYVLAIGALTNVASAILLEPSIVKRIVVVFLGGHSFWHRAAREFNLGQDIPASQLLFDCGVPVIHVPCLHVASHLVTTVHEVQHFLGGRNPLCDYLVSIVREYEEQTSEDPGKRKAWSKVIWDIAVTAWLACPEAFRTEIVHSPVLTDNCTWSFDRSRHLIAQVSWLDRDRIFGDVFAKLAQLR